MEIKGKVTAVRPIERGTSARGPWARATIVVEYDSSSQYPKALAMTNMKDAEKFGQIRVGQTGTFKIDFKHREYNGRDYTDITCWDWSIDQAAPSSGDPI